MDNLKTYIKLKSTGILNCSIYCVCKVRHGAQTRDNLVLREEGNMLGRLRIPGSHIKENLR